MPIFEYECRACGYRFEQLLRAPATPACPSCHSENLERLLSSFAVSSAAMSESALQAARRKVAKSPEQRDRRRSEAEHTLEHLRDDYGITPPGATKTKV